MGCQLLSAAMTEAESDQHRSTPLWQLFLSALGGAFVGALATILCTWLALNAEGNQQEDARNDEFAEVRALRMREQRRPVYEAYRGEWINLINGWVGLLDCAGPDPPGGDTGMACPDQLLALDTARAQLQRSYHDVAV